MNGPRQLVSTIFSLAMLIATAASNVRANQPVAPSDYERVSANGKYKVKITVLDETKGSHAQVAVFEKRENQWRPTWSAERVSPVMPANTFVGNHGTCVVTVGNVNGVSNNDDIVVYRDGKLLQRYSLEDLLSKRPETKLPVFASCMGGWNGSFTFVDQRQRLCLWVDHAREWVLVDLLKGTPTSVDQMTALICEEQARIDAYANLKNKSGDSYEPFRRLARFLNQKDKPIFDELLSRPNDLGCGYQTNSSDDSILYYASNPFRDLAEQALAAIDVGKKDAIGNSNYWSMSDRQNNYRHLGSLNISAKFGKAPKSSDGIIVLWLEPVDREDADKTKLNGPEHSLGIDLFYKFPDRLKKESRPLDLPVKMSLFGVTPGKYRVRGYWNRERKYVHEIGKDFWKRTGEFTLADSPEIEIRKGKAAEAVVSFTKSAPPKPAANDAE